MVLSSQVVLSPFDNEGSIDGVFFPRELCTYLTIVVEHFEQHKGLRLLKISTSTMEQDTCISDILLRAAILQNKPNRELPLEPTTTPVRQFHLTVWSFFRRLSCSCRWSRLMLVHLFPSKLKRTVPKVSAVAS